MSWHLGYADYSLGALNDPIFGGAFKGDIKQLKVWYRNLLTHNGMIAPGTVLTPENAGDAIETLNGEAVKIRGSALSKQVINTRGSLAHGSTPDVRHRGFQSRVGSSALPAARS